ncbi:nucleotidyltransferase family protein [Pelagibius sp. Alg239-R121]|uniref:nucleotidyltransferase family protein n=1 Tax=Pelagibius sp. Alg239-R121 TaxID=2993448 RepID=UPI0024A75CD6|nr:nucleotidyltransferase family protein [Pelagibius sp. Alg239-R121]
MPNPEQEAFYLSRLEAILRTDTEIWPSLKLARALALPDWLIASGAIYQTVWNALTGKPAGYGLKDIDLIYFDGTDVSWEVEDKAIKRVAEAFAAAEISTPVETRNQARVHLWFEQRFGAPYEALSSSAESLTRYASTTHAVGVRLERDGRMTIEAPFGLTDVFNLVLRPNPHLDNKGTYDEKAARCAELWPQVQVIPWL